MRARGSVRQQRAAASRGVEGRRRRFFPRSLGLFLSAASAAAAAACPPAPVPRLRRPREKGSFGLLSLALCLASPLLLLLHSGVLTPPLRIWATLLSPPGPIYVPVQSPGSILPTAAARYFDCQCRTFRRSWGPRFRLSQNLVGASAAGAARAAVYFARRLRRVNPPVHRAVTVIYIQTHARHKTNRARTCGYSTARLPTGGFFCSASASTSSSSSSSTAAARPKLGRGFPEKQPDKKNERKKRGRCRGVDDDARCRRFVFYTPGEAERPYLLSGEPYLVKKHTRTHTRYR